MNYISFYNFFLCAVIFTGCFRPGIEISEPIIAADSLAGGAYFTKDNHGNAVLCWTAGGKGNAQLYYAVYEKQKGTLGKPVAVTPSKGTSMHDESMNKVAFRHDGTVIAVYANKHPTEKNKYAGSILYSQSSDGGKSWTLEKFLHTDTAQNNSRSFFDLATLPDGEVGAVWLDSRLKKGADGTSLFFSKTNGKDGFFSDWLIAEGVCQCCRTDLYVDSNKNVHVVYRAIDTTIKGQIRDFAHRVSLNNGLTFSDPQIISHDNWIIDGCPHTGASIASQKEQIDIVWFTAGGTPGLYYTSATAGQAFQPRQLISQEAHHPQIASFENRSIVVWDGTETQGNQKHDDHTSHHVTKRNITIVVKGTSADDNRILKVGDDGGEFPVITILGARDALVAYTREDKIVMRKVSY
jgi:hypothetical protein